jgi:site-specific DNA-adenine methylase
MLLSFEGFNDTTGTTTIGIGKNCMKSKEDIIIPLKYFGNRQNLTDDLFTLINKKGGNRKYSVFYDLFSGSGSIGLKAIQLDIAERYVINDTYSALKGFWECVRDEKKVFLLIDDYKKIKQSLVSDNKIQKNHYEALQNEFNETHHGMCQNFTSSAQFAFLINHAENGMPHFSKGSQYLKNVPEVYYQDFFNAHFESSVKAIHLLLKDKNIEFANENFTHYQDVINEDDFVFLDPPYPDLEDAEESPDNHIYFRPENKASLRKALKTFLSSLNKKNVSFFMFYGVQGLTDTHPIYLPGQQYLRLAGDLNHPFKEYVENFYVSKDFIPHLKMIFPSRIIKKDYELTSHIPEQVNSKGKVVDYTKVASYIKQQIEDYPTWNIQFPAFLKQWSEKRPLSPAIVIGKLIEIYTNKKIMRLSGNKIQQYAFNVMPEDRIIAVSQSLLNEGNSRSKQEQILIWEYHKENYQSILINLRPLFLAIDFEGDQGLIKLLEATNFMKALFQQEKTLKDIPFNQIPINHIRPKLLRDHFIKTIYTKNGKAKKVINPYQYEFYIYRSIRENLKKSKVHINNSIGYKSFEAEVKIDPDWKQKKDQILNDVNNKVLLRPIDHTLDELEHILEPLIERANKRALNVTARFHKHTGSHLSQKVGSH